MPFLINIFLSFALLRSYPFSVFPRALFLLEWNFLLNFKTISPSEVLQKDSIISIRVGAELFFSPLTAHGLLHKNCPGEFFLCKGRSSNEKTSRDGKTSAKANKFDTGKNKQDKDKLRVGKQWANIEENPGEKVNKWTREEWKVWECAVSNILLSLHLLP